ncbi:MAG: hypothetical protein ACLQD8_01460 [Thermoplasmata archaeon]
MATPDPSPVAPAVSGPPAPPVPSSPDELTVLSGLDLARTLGLLLALVAGLLFLVLLSLGIVRAFLGTGFGGFVGAGYCLVSAVVNYLIWRELPSIGPLVSQRQYSVARDRLLVWMVLGLLFFVVDGIVLLIAWLKLDTMTRSPLLGVPGTPAPPACPRCGAPLSWIAEYQRNYCYRCSAYA